MWAIFFQFFKYKKIGQNFPRKEKNYSNLHKGEKKSIQKMTKFFNNKLLAHITNHSFGICTIILYLLRVLLKSGALLVPSLDCCLVPHPLLLLIWKFLFKKKTDQKGQTWHGIAVWFLIPPLVPSFTKSLKKKGGPKRENLAWDCCGRGHLSKHKNKTKKWGLKRRGVWVECHKLLLWLLSTN